MSALEPLARQVLQVGGCSPLSADSAGADDDDPARRYQIAVALQICLDRSPGFVSDHLRRLLLELAPEISSLKIKLGSLEHAVGELEATRFAPTTRLRGQSRWYFGGLHYYGNQIGPGNTYRVGNPEGTGSLYSLQDALTLTYDIQLNFDSSFSGKDLLRIRLRAGDGAYSGLRGNLVTPMSRLDGVTPFCSPGSQQRGDCRNNILSLDKIYYRLPLGPAFTLTFGPRLGQKDMLAIWPSLYGTSERILSAFDYAGAVGAYSDVKGGGLGLSWRQPGRKSHYWVASAVYVAAGAPTGIPSEGGLLTDASRGATTLQLGFVGQGWAMVGAYTFNQAGARQDEIITPLSAQTWPTWAPGLNGAVQSFGISGYWDPTKASDWVPVISAGWGFNQNNYSLSGPNAASPLLRAQSQSWMLGLEWKNVLERGNTLGLAIGQPKFLTSFSNNTGQSGAYDTSWIMEAWYKIQVTDALSLTPAFFWLPRPRGQLSQSDSSWNDAVLPTSNGSTLGVFGLVIKATFRF